MLALVSIITTAVNGCGSLENNPISAGLPLSRIEKSACDQVRNQPAGANRAPWRRPGPSEHVDRNSG